MVHLQKKVGTDLASEASTPRHPAHGVVLPEVGRSRPPQAAPKSWPMLEVRELTKRYNSIRFLKIPFTCSFLPGKAKYHRAGSLLLVRLHQLRLHHGFPRSVDAAPPPLACLSSSDWRFRRWPGWSSTGIVSWMKGSLSPMKMIQSLPSEGSI